MFTARICLLATPDASPPAAILIGTLMPQTPQLAVALSACRSPWLRGSVRVPGDRDLTRLALILAALARGPSRIEHANAGPDIGSLVGALRQLCVTVAQK